MNKKNLTTSPVFLILIFLTIIWLLGASFSFYFIRYQLQTDLKDFRNGKIAGLKQDIKSSVDIVHEFLQYNQLSVTQDERLERVYGNRVKSVIQVVDSILKAKEQDINLGKITPEQAKQTAQEQINQIRYEPSGYVWMIDTGLPYPKMINNPAAPELNGKLLDDVKFNYAAGKKQNLFQAIVYTAQQNYEGGFINYLWPKKNADSVVVEVPKLTYVKLFKPWNLIVGAGIYLDNAVDEIIRINTEVINAIRYNQGTGYFFVLSNELPYPRTLIHPVESKKYVGRLMDNSEVITKNTKQQLFAYIVNLCRTQGEGFVEYEYTQLKPDSEPVKITKLTYVKLYKPLDWIIGTGESLDEIDSLVAEKQSAHEVILRTYLISLGLLYIILIAVFLLFGFIMRNKLNLWKTL